MCRIDQKTAVEPGGWRADEKEAIRLEFLEVEMEFVSTDSGLCTASGLLWFGRTAVTGVGICLV
jgi:hypothetical protein